MMKVHITHRTYVTKAIITMAFLCCTYLTVNAQAIDKGFPLGGWYILSLKGNFATRWSFFAETQFRAWKPNKAFFYHEYKGGITYALNKTITSSLGVGHYTTYPIVGDESFASPITSQELRVWQQFNLSNSLDRLKLEHRFRIEQRYFTTQYRNRFRYRINATVPINKTELVPNTFFVSAYNEVFLNNEPSHFERNRLYIGTGYEFNDQITLMMGWLNQYDYTIRRAQSKDFIQVNLLLSLSNWSKDRERHPAPVD